MQTSTETTQSIATWSTALRPLTKTLKVFPKIMICHFGAIKTDEGPVTCIISLSHKITLSAFVLYRVFQIKQIQWIQQAHLLQRLRGVVTMALSSFVGIIYFSWNNLHFYFYSFVEL